MQRAIIPCLAIIIGVIVFSMLGCRIEPKNPVDVGNEWPRVYLVNVPPDSSQLPHAPIVYWYGADPDGYIVEYHWAVDDTSVWEVIYVDSALGTEDTIAFSAPLPDTEFTHIFYVRARDNEGEVTIADSIPRRVFRVTNIPPVNTGFEEAPDSGATVFVRMDTLATWHGVFFEWSTEDSDEVFAPQFSWRWDNGAWSEWSEATEKYFTGEDDIALRTNGQHWLYLRARDDAMAIDSSSAPWHVDVCVPTFEYELLVIDQTRNYGGNQGQPTDQEVDDFYELVLQGAGWSQFDTLDDSNENRAITHCDIGKYKLVFLHSDDLSTAGVPQEDIFSQYLDVGGRLFIGGHTVTEGVQAAFRTAYLGIDSSVVNANRDFVGAEPQYPERYPDISYLEVDTTKIMPGWGGVPDVGYHRLSNIFMGLYTYDSGSDDPDFEGRAAVLFQFEHDEDDPLTFRTGAAAFPLYPIRVDAQGEPLATALKTVLDWLAE